MKTFESRCEQLFTMSKNWKTDSLFLSEAQKLTDELTVDAEVRLGEILEAIPQTPPIGFSNGNRKSLPPDIKERIRALKGLITAQETWLWTQREALLEAPESPRVQWVM
jgi:hypothetical protein